MPQDLINSEKKGLYVFKKLFLYLYKFVAKSSWGIISQKTLIFREFEIFRQSKAFKNIYESKLNGNSPVLKLHTVPNESYHF